MKQQMVAAQVIDGQQLDRGEHDMFLIIYQKSDGQPVLQESISSFLTPDSYDMSLSYGHVIRHLGGSKEDYGDLWVSDNTDIQKTFTHEFTILDGEIVFGDEKVSEESPQEPTEIEVLQQENVLLKAQNQALADRTDFHEELIVELAMQIYQ